jgi:hypothetical protein
MCAIQLPSRQRGGIETSFSALRNNRRKKCMIMHANLNDLKEKREWNEANKQTATAAAAHTHSMRERGEAAQEERKLEFS